MGGNAGPDDRLPPLPDAPLVRVRAFSLMGGVVVERKKARQRASRRAQASASRTIIAAADAMSCTDAHSRTEWYSWPPVKRFGVGRPRALRIEPSVPPRIGSRTTSRPSARIASLGRSHDLRERRRGGGACSSTAA